MEKRVRTENLFMYGLGDIYGGGAFLVIGTLFLIYLTDVVGLSPALAGLVLVVGKGWDAISDPLMGYLSDNTKSKYGRRRVYFLVGIVPVALSFALLWIPVPWASEFNRFLYYLFAYIFFSTVFTMVMVPYSALNADMTDDYQTRTKLSGARMLFSQISALLSGVVPKIVVDYFSVPANGGLDQRSGFLVMGLAFGILYALPWIFVYRGTWEVPQEYQDSPKRLVQKLAGFASVFSNRSFRIHLVMYISAYVAMDFLMALFVYFLTYYLGRPGLFSMCMLAILLTQIMLLPVYVKISNKRGKALAYILGLSIWGTGMLSLLVLTPSTPASLLIAICVIIGAGLSAGVMVPWAIMPSIVDVDEVMTLAKRTGVYSGMMTLVRKLAQAVALWSIGVLLSVIGYVPNQAQSPQTLVDLKLLFIFIPISLIIVGILAASRFRITPEKHQILASEIKRLKSGGKRSDVSPQVKAVCEELSGTDFLSGKSKESR